MQNLQIQLNQQNEYSWAVVEDSAVVSDHRKEAAALLFYGGSDDYKRFESADEADQRTFE